MKEARSHLDQNQHLAPTSNNTPPQPCACRSILDSGWRYLDLAHPDRPSPSLGLFAVDSSHRPTFANTKHHHVAILRRAAAEPRLRARGPKPPILPVLIRTTRVRPRDSLTSILWLQCAPSSRWLRRVERLQLGLRRRGRNLGSHGRTGRSEDGLAGSLVDGGLRRGTAAAGRAGDQAGQHQGKGT